MPSTLYSLIISANTDTLTGLPNRRNVMLKLDSAVSDFSLLKIQAFSIAIFDIDNLDLVQNNQYKNNALCAFKMIQFLSILSNRRFELSLYLASRSPLF